MPRALKLKASSTTTLALMQAAHLSPRNKQRIVAADMIVEHFRKIPGEGDPFSLQDTITDTVINALHDGLKPYKGAKTPFQRARDMLLGLRIASNKRHMVSGHSATMQRLLQDILPILKQADDANVVNEDSPTEAVRHD